MQVRTLLSLASWTKHLPQDVKEDQPEEWHDCFSGNVSTSSLYAPPSSIFAFLNTRIVPLRKAFPIEGLLHTIVVYIINYLTCHICALARVLHKLYLNLQSEDGVMGKETGQARRSKHSTKSSSSTVLCDPSTFLEEWKQQIKVKGNIPTNQQRLTFTSQVVYREPVVLANFVQNRQWQIVVHSTSKEELCKIFQSWRARLYSKDTSAELLCSLVLTEEDDLVSTLHSKTAEELRLLGVPCNVFYLSFDKWIPNHKATTVDGINVKNQPEELELQIDETFRQETFNITLEGLLNGKSLPMPLNYVMNGKEVTAKLLMVEQTACYREEQNLRHQASPSSTNVSNTLVRVENPSVARSGSGYCKDYIIHIDKDCEFAIVSSGHHHLRCIVLPVITISLNTEAYPKRQLLLELIGFDSDKLHSKPLALPSTSSQSDPTDLSSSDKTCLAENGVKVTKHRKKKKTRKSMKEKGKSLAIRNSVDEELIVGSCIDRPDDEHESRTFLKDSTMGLVWDSKKMSEKVSLEKDESLRKSTVDTVGIIIAPSLVDREHGKRSSSQGKLSGPGKQQLGTKSKRNGLRRLDDVVSDSLGSISRPKALDDCPKLHQENASSSLGPLQKSSYGTAEKSPRSCDEEMVLTVQNADKTPMLAKKDQQDDARQVSHVDEECVVLEKHILASVNGTYDASRIHSRGWKEPRSSSCELMEKTKEVQPYNKTVLMKGGLPSLDRHSAFSLAKDSPTGTSLNSTKKHGAGIFRSGKMKDMDLWSDGGFQRSISTQSSMQRHGNHFAMDTQANSSVEMRPSRSDACTQKWLGCQDPYCHTKVASEHASQDVLSENSRPLMSLPLRNRRGGNSEQVNQVWSTSFPSRQGMASVDDRLFPLSGGVRKASSRLLEGTIHQASEKDGELGSLALPLCKGQQFDARNGMAQGFLELSRGVHDLQNGHLKSNFHASKPSLNVGLPECSRENECRLNEKFNVMKGGSFYPSKKVVMGASESGETYATDGMPCVTSLQNSETSNDCGLSGEASAKPGLNDLSTLQGVPTPLPLAAAYEPPSRKGDWNDFFCSLQKAISAASESQATYQHLSSIAGTLSCELEKILKAVQPVFKARQSVLHSWNFTGCGCARTVTESCRSTNLQKLADVPLSSLWNWYEEPSCFGLEVKLMDRQHNAANMEGGAIPFQAFFVPSLSGIQLFGWSRNTRTASEHKGMDESSLLDSSSLSQPNFSILLPKPRCKNDRRNGHSESVCCKEPWREKVVCESPGFTNGLVSDAVNKCNCDVKLVFEFFEGEKPQQRKPLTERIKQLVAGHVSPESSMSGSGHVLESMRISELHPASWFAVAWYPIYRIPDGAFRAAFLTYHSLSCLRPPYSMGCGSLGSHGRDFMAAPVVGLMSYNAQAEEWLSIAPECTPRNHNSNFPADLDPAKALQHYVTKLEASAAAIARGSSCNKLSCPTVKHSDFSFFLSRRR